MKELIIFSVILFVFTSIPAKADTAWVLWSRSIQPPRGWSVLDASEDMKGCQEKLAIYEEILGEDAGTKISKVTDTHTLVTRKPAKPFNLKTLKDKPVGVTERPDQPKKKKPEGKGKLDFSKVDMSKLPDQPSSTKISASEYLCLPGITDPRTPRGAP